MSKQPKYDFEYEVNGQRITLKDKTLEEINVFIGQLKSENESSMLMKRIKEEDEEER